MKSTQIEILERALQREKAARKAAEEILEQKSTELYKTSEKLRASNEKLEEILSSKTSELKGVFQNIIDAYVVIEISGEVIQMNQAAVELLGYDIEEENINLLRVVKAEYLEYTLDAFQELFMHGKFSNYKAVIITKSGEEKIVQINASIIYNKKGEAIAAQGIARDITEESKMKKLLEQQKQQLDIIFKNSPIGVSLSNPRSKGLLMVNKAMCKMLGYTQEEFKNINIQQLTHPDDEKESATYRKKMFDGEIDFFTVEKRYLRKDKEIVWAKTSVTAVRDKNGAVDYQVATIEDVTKQKNATEKLKESEKRMSTLIMNLQTGILLEDEHRKISVTNQRFCDFFKIPAPPEALTGADCSNAAEESKHHFQNPEAFVKGISKLLEEKKPVLAEEINLADGRIFERSYIPIFIEEVYRGHLWSYDDVTLRKKYKDSLKAEREKYANIIANMHLGLLEIDSEGNVLMANNAFCDISGYSPKEIVGKNAALLLLQDPQAFMEKHNERRNRGVADSYEVTVFNKNKQTRHWLVSGAPNFDVNGNRIGSIGIHLDITERKSMEKKQKELLKDLENQNEKLNDYAHIVSHDLKSPLRNISALLSWTKEDFREKLGPQSLTNLDLMQAKVEKMDHLIENILKYSSIDNTAISEEAINLQKLVEDIMSMIYIPGHIHVTIKNPLPIIKADNTRMQQLFQNLISNAVNYIDKKKGFVEIDVEDRQEKFIFSIKDNGCGIAAEHHEKIFKIFSSASNHKESTGVGLSIVKKILDLYNGEIWLDSTPGVGTTFYFSLNKTHENPTG